MLMYESVLYGTPSVQEAVKILEIDIWQGRMARLADCPESEL